jgi:hypothetical protein
MGFGIEQDMTSITKQLNQFVDDIRQQVEASLVEIRDVVVKEVTDNRNWNPEAVYKNGGMNYGLPYTLEDTGQFLNTVRDKSLNTITSGGSQITLGIGHTTALDSLRPSHEGAQKGVKYWRMLVYGRARIPGWKFIPTSGNRGFSLRRSNSAIAPSEATHMFENGLAVAQRYIPDIVNEHLASVVDRYRRS